MRILVIGYKGQLGHELFARGANKGFEIIKTDLPDFNITDQQAVQIKIKETRADLVLNASAYTAVDKAESEPALAFAVNRDGPKFLAASCAENNIPLIHISTDYVFDGNKEGPYMEADPVSPIGIYGRSKEAGECEIRNHLHEHIIIRTAWLYGVHGNNFVKTMLRLGLEKENLNVVDDQFGCPTNAADLADAILIMADTICKEKDVKWGTYHYCGKGQTSWHGFAEMIFKLAKQNIKLKIKQVTPIPASAYPTPAQRPANSVLDCSLILDNFNIQTRPWLESLEEMIKCLDSMDLINPL